MKKLSRVRGNKWLLSAATLFALISASGAGTKWL
jgi:hypothetical protein